MVLAPCTRWLCWFSVIGLLDGLDVESPVLRKFLILGGDHGERQIGRYARRDPPSVPRTRRRGRGSTQAAIWLSAMKAL